MNGVMRRKVGTKTLPWTKAALNHTPPPPHDEDIPATKKLRLQTSFSTAVEDVVDAHTSNTVTTDSPDNPVDVAPRDNVAASLLHAETYRAPRRTWTSEADAQLADAVTKHGNNWIAIAAIIPGRNNKECRQRWAKSLDPSLDRKTGKWTTEEGAKLIEAVKKCGKDWAAVAALVPDRTRVQCRQRWIFSADPSIDRVIGKCKWTLEEDAKLIDAVKKCGKDWATVAALVPGRTNEQCRKKMEQPFGPNHQGEERKHG
jgi:hypothetical protein